MPDPAAPASARARPADQAAGLRRLFDVGPRLLPVLVTAREAQSAGMLAQLAQAFARTGERTLLLDAARAQAAAALGLKARYDLLHLARGECTLPQALLDAGEGLAVLPAARAAQAARGCRNALLAALASQLPAFDLVVLAVPPALAALGAGGEALLPLAPERARWPTQLAALRQARDIAVFRLLFPGMEESAAISLCRELARASERTVGVTLRFGAALRSARDWVRVARAAAGWDLLRLPRRSTRID
ncbi:MAG: hypothetical protein NZL99_03985 [Burkholderiaceae bacterium]|nr:hypothetical protein [Burkholderiaceae bacterium]